MQETDVQETARLLFMDNPEMGFAEFTTAMRKFYDDRFSIGESKAVYTMYRGWDGRVGPSHDFMTGKRLR